MYKFFVALSLLLAQLAYSSEFVRWPDGAVGLSNVSHFVVKRDAVPIAIVPSTKVYFLDHNGERTSTYSVDAVFLDATPDKEIVSQKFSAISGDEISMTWQDNSDNEDGFTIERSLDGNTFDTIGTVAADVNEFTDTAVLEGIFYIYRVNAFNAFGYSGYSNNLFTFVLLNKPTNIILSSN